MDEKTPAEKNGRERLVAGRLRPCAPFYPRAKNDLKPHLSEQWMIPPDENARFVAKMEDVLDVYRRPYDPDRPVICMDEMSRQLLKHVQEPIEPEPGTPRRLGYHYERNGTVNLFTFFEPLAAHRVACARDHRTMIDWVECVRTVLDEHYPKAERIVLVMDNLYTRPFELV